jgi:alpha-beta hydrolase superfamily lysophospholipase
VPLDGPGLINHIARGPAYVWAVLHDPRITLGGPVMRHKMGGSMMR